jgi:hypothetical protein
MDFSGKKPWNANRFKGKINEQAQTNLLKALLNSFWGKDWFAGGFLWKWFPQSQRYEPGQNNRFSIQGKQAELMLSRFYKANEVK